MMNFLDGYKTYIVASLGLIYAVIGYSLGEMSAVQALQFAQVSLAAAGLRSAISTATTTTVATVTTPVVATTVVTVPSITSEQTN